MVRCAPRRAATSARIPARVGAYLGGLGGPDRDAEAPSRPTISRWLSGTTLPTGFRQLELMVAGVREHSRNPPRQVRETLLRAGWWRGAYERALAESGRVDAGNGQQPQIVYQGLAPYGRHDAKRFFGRGPAIESLRTRIDALFRSRAPGVLVVLGPSGIGKSSLLAAGLLPALERHGLDSVPEAAAWPAAVITPGPDPLAALAEALGPPGHSSSPVVDTEASAAGRPMFLVVDQFEEVFTVDEDRRQRFVTALVDAATPRADSTTPAVPARPAAVVLIACRNDFYPDLRRLAPLKSALDAPFNLDPLTSDELSEAIKEPARRAGITIGNDLVTRLLADSGVISGGTVDGQLPLISHVLALMNQSGPMTVRAYERVGGLDGAVAHTATQAWERLQAAGVGDTALALLVRMVRVGDHHSQDTHQRLDRHDVAPLEGPTAQALDVLAAARLITVGEDTVQITHEALWRAWPLLRDAIDSERTDHVRRQAIDRSARIWDEAGRPDEQLYRGTLLSDAHRVTTRSASGAVSVTGITREFLAAADEQERRFARRRHRVRGAVTAVVAVIAALAVIAGHQAVTRYQSQQRAILAEVKAHAKALQPTDPSMAAQLYLAAYQRQPDPALYTTLLDTQNQPLAHPLRGHRGVARAVIAGSTVVSGSDDGTIRMWAADQAGTHQPTSTLPVSGPVTGLAVVPRPPGRYQQRGQREVRSERAAGMERRRPAPPNSADPGVAERPSGDQRSGGLRKRSGGQPGRNYSDGRGGRRHGRPVEHHRPRPPGPTAGTGRRHAPTQAVAISPDGDVLAAGGVAGALRLWDTSDPARPRLIAQPPVDRASSILAAAISPDGTTLAAASSDSSVTLWNIADPTGPIPLGQPLRTDSGRGIGSVQFSPDGNKLIAGSGDGIIRVWSLPQTRLTASSGTAVDLAFRDDGGMLAVGNLDNNSIYLWDTTDPSSPAPVGPPMSQGGALRARGFNVDFAGRDDDVLVSSGGRTIRAWSMQDPRQPTQLGPDLVLPVEVGGQAISPDGAPSP
ncbi:hypothetical protein L7F22_010003 [Adiantum nelumboides]|nr:hypothetical protein [Adiantum nelumboides]